MAEAEVPKRSTRADTGGWSQPWLVGRHIAMVKLLYATTLSSELTTLDGSEGAVQ